MISIKKIFLGNADQLLIAFLNFSVIAKEFCVLEDVFLFSVIFATFPTNIDDVGMQDVKQKIPPEVFRRFVTYNQFKIS